jgi:hypothetical protein
VPERKLSHVDGVAEINLRGRNEGVRDLLCRYKPDKLEKLPKVAGQTLSYLNVNLWQGQ